MLNTWYLQTGHINSKCRMKTKVCRFIVAFHRYFLHVFFQRRKIELDLIEKLLVLCITQYFSNHSSRNKWPLRVPRVVKFWRSHPTSIFPSTRLNSRTKMKDFNLQTTMSVNSEFSIRIVIRLINHLIPLNRNKLSDALKTSTFLLDKFENILKARREIETPPGSAIKRYQLIFSR